MGWGDSGIGGFLANEAGTRIAQRLVTQARATHPDDALGRIGHQVGRPQRGVIRRAHQRSHSFGFRFRL